MKILVLNQDWFAEELRAMGHEVVTCGLAMASHLEVKIDHPLLHIDSVIRSLPNGFEPDRILLLDNSSPLLFTGLDETDIPVLFYSVDAHHHADLHKYFAAVFDYTLVAQRDYLPAFHSLGESPEWMPLWATHDVASTDEKALDAVFVGNLDPKLHPVRAKFFEELSKKVPVEFKMGEWWKIFPHAEIVINQTVKGDLNFRVFEAMVCGSLLLTEDIENGLRDLFTPGEHLVLYRRGDVEDAAAKIRHYLDHRDEARRVARSGRDLVLRAHSRRARAHRIAEILSGLKKRTATPFRFFGMMMNYSALARFYRDRDDVVTLTCLASAMKCAETAMRFGESVTEEISSHLVILSLEYERRTRSGAGTSLLLKCAEQYAHDTCLQLARIRALLNLGHVDQARESVARISPEPPEAVFSKAESLIASLLEEFGR